jgi:hypothetical protein
MNTMILGRLVWKEFRLLRSFGLAVALLCCVCLAILAWRLPARSEPATLYLTAMGIAACYALACGTMAFAGEREARTDDFQRALPVAPRQLLAGKLAHALLSTLALIVVVWLMAWCAAYLRWGDARSTASLSAAGALPALLGGLTALQLLAWSLLFSLRSSHPLRIVIASFVANALVSYPISWLLSDIPEDYRTVLYFPSFFGDLPTVVPRLIVVAIVLGLDFAFVARWFRDTSQGGTDVSDATIATLAARTGWWSGGRVRPQWQRLLWQEWRATRFMVGPLVLTYVILAVAIAGFGTSQGSDQLAAYLEAPLVVIGGLMGTFVFHSDQRRRQFRFLAEHGVSPRRLWWTRQVSWFALLLVLCLAALGADFLAWFTSYSRSAWDPRFIAACLGMTLICYGVGQLLSLQVSSAIVRIALAVLYCLPLGFWATLMMALGIPLLWSVAPIPIVLLIASRASVRDWMVERTGRRVRWKTTLILCIPAIAIGAGVIGFRSVEIPNIEPQFPGLNMTPEQLAAAKAKGTAYLRVWDGHRVWGDNLPHDPQWENWDPTAVRDPAEYQVTWLSDEQVQWLDRHQELGEQILNVTPGDYVLPSPAEYREHLAAIGQTPPRPQEYDEDTWAAVSMDLFARALPEHLVKSALRCQRGGDLEGAVDRYMAALGFLTRLRAADNVSISDWTRTYWIATHCLHYWCAERGQTAERIRRTLDTFRQLHADAAMPFLEATLERNYTVGKQAISGEDEAFRSGNWRVRAGHQVYLDWFYRLLPWESWRALRLHNTSVAWSLNAIQETRAAIQRGDSVPYRHRHYDKDLQRWSDNTVTPVDDCGWAWGTEYCSELVDVTVVQRVTTIVLALEGWRLEHGALPRSLDELAPTWLARIPVDACTGQPFQFHPDGASEPITWYDETIRISFQLPAHVPFIEAEQTVEDWADVFGRKDVSMRRIFPIPTPR